MMDFHVTKKNCWDTFTFNNSTCTWDNDGTTQPAAPEKTNCWDYFQHLYCTWDNDGTAKPTAPTRKLTVGILLLSTILLVLGTMMMHNLQHQKK
jgi:hypothetical protein